MARGAPGGAGMLRIGMAEGEVDTGELLVLQDMADNTRERDVGTDRVMVPIASRCAERQGERSRTMMCRNS